MKRTRSGAGVAAALTAITITFGAAAMAADTYRWIDQQGRVNFSDRPPPPSARQVEERQYGTAPADTAPAYTVRKAEEDFPVELYTAEGCGELCASARDFLGKRGIRFAERQLSNEQDLAAYRANFGTPEEVPAITIGKQTMKGYEPGRWNRMLDDAGYPKTPVPPR